MAQTHQSKTHYQTLSVHHQAPQLEIKRAYRRLAKQYHPDCNPGLNNHDRITALNLAYEILSNPQTRASYDRTLGLGQNYHRDRNGIPYHQKNEQNQAQKTEQKSESKTNQKPNSKSRSGFQAEDQKFERWYQQVYEPIITSLSQILEDLDLQIDQLADDPFDDELMGDFEVYLDDCRRSMQNAQQVFRSIPNPKAAARVAEYLYYALSHLGDGMEELNYFTRNFDDQHLHTGQEMWRIVEEMCDRAQGAMGYLLEIS
jgi:molecular chaperone DnaJ